MGEVEDSFESGAALRRKEISTMTVLTSSRLMPSIFIDGSCARLSTERGAQIYPPREDMPSRNCFVSSRMVGGLSPSVIDFAE